MQKQVNNPFGNAPDMNEMAADMMKNYALGKVREQYEENKGYFSMFSLDGLKIYFDVTNHYVLHKLKIILFPFLLKEDQWKMSGSSIGFQGNDDFDSSHLQSEDSMYTPKNNLQAPDLYIPLMSFVSYILIIGFFYGMNKKFESEKLSLIFSKLIFFWFFEALVQKGLFVCFNFGKADFFELLSFTGYKFVILCLITGSQIIFGQMASYAVLGVFGSLFCYFFYCTLSRYLTAHTFAEHARESSSSINKKSFQLGNCAAQFALLFFLSYN